jgi:UDP-2,3-diacylglucosamine hydrolase
MTLAPGKKVYFLSDFHLGAPDAVTSLAREKRIVAFLCQAQQDASVIFIVGDMFDFWYEYGTVVPKGYTRILGKLAEITDSGIKVYFFVGNHDMWMSGYFEQELNIPVFHEEREYEFNGKLFLVAHGDGLGPGDHKYKFLKKIFRSRICQWLFGVLHPSLGMGIANYFSRKSREATGKTDKEFLGEDKEWLIIFSKEKLRHKKYNYFIFGHRHLPVDLPLNEHSRYINLGDWIRYNSYAVFDGEQLMLKYYNT